MFYNLQKSARESIGSGITLVYTLFRHNVISDCRKCKKQCVEYYIGQAVHQGEWRKNRRKQVIFGVTSVRSSKPATYKLLWQHSVSTVSVQCQRSPKDGSKYKPHLSNPFQTKDSVPHNDVTMNCSLSWSAENDQKPVTHTSHITWQGIKPGLLNVMTSSNQPETIRDTS